MTDDVATVAAGLTKAQREVVLRLNGHSRQRAVTFSGSIAAALRLPNTRRGALTDRDMTRNSGLKVARYFLTPLGLSVRDHILKEQKG